MKTKMSTSDGVFNFLLTSHSTFPDGKTELLMELLRANGKCFNCKWRPCLVGQDILQRHSRLFWNGMVVAKKDPPSDGTCGFTCNQPNQKEETAGLAVMFNLPEPNPQGYVYADAKQGVSLRCITHQAPIHGGRPVKVLPGQNIPGFVFACGVGSQLSWQNIMG